MSERWRIADLSFQWEGGLKMELHVFQKCVEVPRCWILTGKQTLVLTTFEVRNMPADRFFLEGADLAIYTAHSMKGIGSHTGVFIFILFWSFYFCSFPPFGITREQHSHACRKQLRKVQEISPPPPTRLNILLVLAVQVGALLGLMLYSTAVWLGLWPTKGWTGFKNE